MKKLSLFLIISFLSLSCLSILFHPVTAGEETRTIINENEVIPEKDWNQKPEDIKKYNIDILTMGSDWEGNPKFEYLKDYCEVRFTKRPFTWSSTAFRKKVDEYAKEMEKERE